ncbi:MAG: histidine kinase [Bacteroidales bacterium]|nr:histidine kinase [Bacteroidales bacterium]
MNLTCCLRRLLPWGICLLSLFPLHGQDFPYTIFDTEKGMPSNQVFNIEFDNNHILWAATDRGVVRYDGYHFKTLTTSEGLKENSILRLFKDRTSAIWLTSISNYVYRAYNDTVIETPSSTAIATLPDSLRFIQQLVVNPDSSLYIGFNRPGLFLIRQGAAPKRLTRHLAGHETASVCIKRLPSGKFIWDMPTQNPPGNKIPTRVDTANGWIYLTCSVQDPTRSFRKKALPLNGDEWLFSFSNKLFRLNGCKLTGSYSFNHEILALHLDYSGNVRVAVNREGVYLFRSGNLHTRPELYLRGEWVSDINQDHEGNLWFSTLNHGILMVSNPELQIYASHTTDDKDRIIRSLAVLNNTLYFGTELGSLYRLQPTANDRYRIEKIDLPRLGTGAIRKMHPTPQNTLMLVKNKLVEVNPPDHPASFRLYHSYPYAITDLPDNRVMVTYSNCWDLYTPDRKALRITRKMLQRIYPSDSLLLKAVRAIRVLYTDTTHNTLWMGSQDAGIWSKQQDTFTAWAPLDPLLGKRSAVITRMNNTIVTGTKEFGLVLIDANQKISHINKKNSALSSDLIDALYAENDTTLWVGTGKGVNRLTFDPRQNTLTRIDFFTMREGMPSNRIFQILKFEGNLWIATNKGLVKMNLQPDIPFEKIHPVVVIDEVLANEHPVAPWNGMVLAPNNNNITIRYKPVTYRKSLNVKHYYRLEGLEKEWVTSDNLEARYPNLKPGRYHFILRAEYPSFPGKLDEKSFSFTILKHWYETRGMILVYFLLGFLLIYSFIMYLIRALKIREDRKQRLLLAEKQALLSQMNPHFIFNSLNSIQSFILDNNEYLANTYLTRFSSLIRRILDNSKKNMIPLAEEIETLKLYLSLEHLRFEDRFHYTIQKDPRLDANEIMIPPMLIQPFVENAIWHGIAQLKEGGKVTIDFKSNHNRYYCRIRDNGIGRARAGQKKNPSPDHTPTGINNVQERIDLMNRISNNQIEWRIEDLYNPDGSPAGTLIELILPLLWN